MATCHPPDMLEMHPNSLEDEAMFRVPLKAFAAFLRQRNNSVLFWPGDTREAELSRLSSASHGVPAMLRETREDLGRSPSTEKHKCIVLTMKDRVRTFETKPSVSCAHCIQDMTAPIIHQVLLKSSLANHPTQCSVRLLWNK